MPKGSRIRILRMRKGMKNEYRKRCLLMAGELDFVYSPNL